MKPLDYYSKLAVSFASLQKGGTLNLASVATLGKQLKSEGFVGESEYCLELCLRAMDEFIARKEIDNCLSLEALIYNSFIKTTETEEHYFKIFNNFSEKLQCLGREQASKLPALRGFQRNNKVCFVLHAGVVLGHTEVMLETIDGFAHAGIDAEVYCAVLGSQLDPALREMLAARGVELIFAGKDCSSLSQTVARVRYELSVRSIYTVVWVSVPITASYALALRLAPRQVLWSLKLHPVFISEVDVHICAGHPSEVSRVYHERRWDVAPYPLTRACRPNDSADVSRWRQQFDKNAILVGTLAREEKLESRQFLAAIGTILSINPRAHYIWTGRVQSPAVLMAFEDFGVSDRCHFIGWVDTNLVAEALDVFLESFPFGCGVTGFQAMGHNTPLLSMCAQDTLFGTLLRAEFDGIDRPLTRTGCEQAEILTALTLPHYIELGSKLIADDAFRAEIAEREQAYFARQLRALPVISKRLWFTMTQS